MYKIHAGAPDIWWTFHAAISPEIRLNEAISWQMVELQQITLIILHQERYHLNSGEVGWGWRLRHFFFMSAVLSLQRYWMRSRFLSCGHFLSKAKTRPGLGFPFSEEIVAQALIAAASIPGLTISSPLNHAG
jgi:hypothetical protein